MTVERRKNKRGKVDRGGKEDEKVAEDNGHELDDEGHGKDLNRQWRRGGQAG